MTQTAQTQNKDNGFTYEIKKHIATLSTNRFDNTALELNLVSYRGAEPKLDLRKWNKGTNQLLKGVTLNKEEAEKLKNALVEELAQ
jgi:hypothetical protein